MLNRMNNFTTYSVGRELKCFLDAYFFHGYRIILYDFARQPWRRHKNPETSQRWNLLFNRQISGDGMECCDVFLRWRNPVLKIVLKTIKNEKWNIDKPLFWFGVFFESLCIFVIKSVYHYKVWASISFHHLPSRPVKRAWMRMSFRRQKEFWRLRHSWVGWFNHQGCDGWNFWSLKKQLLVFTPWR